LGDELDDDDPGFCVRYVSIAPIPVGVVAVFTQDGMCEGFRRQCRFVAIDATGFPCYLCSDEDGIYNPAVCEGFERFEYGPKKVPVPPAPPPNVAW
jgi:hypothetical protein